MDYEEYKGKLLDLKGSIEELKKMQNENYQRYRKFIDDMPGISINKRMEQLEVFNNQYVSMNRRYDVQLAFIEQLIYQVSYREIFDDVLKKLGDNGVNVSEKAINSQSKNDALSAFQPKYASSQTVPREISNKNMNNVQGVSAQKNTESKFYEKYIPQVLKNYGLSQPDDLLDVCEKFNDDLSNLTLSTWDSYAEKDKISLNKASGNAKYYAYKLPDYDGRFYFAVPTKSVRFADMQIVKGAFLTFFDLPLNEIKNSNGVMPKLIRPAVLEKREDGLYYLKEKGKYEY